MRIREHESVVSKYDAFRVDPRKLKIKDGYNVRDFSTLQAQESLAILKEQIREKGGVVVPLEVRMEGDDVYIVSGHRRHRACIELIDEGMEIVSVPAVTEPAGVNDAERVLNLVLHNEGYPLTMIEKAEVVRRLLNMGWDREKISNRMGYKTPNSVANFELLLIAPEQVREAVRQGEIAPSTAIELVRKEGDGAGKKLTEIKERAAKRGKDKASIRDVTQSKGKGSTAFDIEKRNERRIAEHTDQQKADLSAVEDVLEILGDLAKRGVKPAVMAAELGTSAVSASRAEAWLGEFCAALQRNALERNGEVVAA